MLPLQFVHEGASAGECKPFNLVYLFFCDGGLAPLAQDICSDASGNQSSLKAEVEPECTQARCAHLSLHRVYQRAYARGIT